jgi:glycosyltransferase involved in cell wall biosynthesis
VTFVGAQYPGAAKEELLDGLRVVRLGGLHSLWLRTFGYYMAQGRGRYDVVVVEGFGGSRIPRLSPLYVNEPIITEWHQIHRELFAVQYPKVLNPALNLLERSTAWVHRNTLVRAGTLEWQAAFPSIGFKPENVFLVPVSIRDEWLAEREVRGVAAPNILWIGKLRRYKCPDHIVRAMAEVVKQVPRAKLTLAIRRDDLAYEQLLHDLVTSLGLESNVVFRLNVSEAEKRDLLDEARVLVLPSVVEGFGIVVLEAGACGVPVVASSGVPEGAVRDGFNGLRYPFADIPALAGAMVRVLSDDALHNRLSQNALANVERFRWSRVGAEFEKIVLAAADRGRSAVGAPG